MGLQNYYLFGNKNPTSGYLVKNSMELNSIPSNVQDLWIQLFDTSEIVRSRVSGYLSLRTMVIGNNLFRRANRLEITNLPRLQSIEIGNTCFDSASSLSLVGMVGLVDFIQNYHNSSR